jgi:hypothetical protein
MTAGYSKRSLVDKLGLKPGQRAAILGAPAGYDATLGPLPEGTRPAASLEGGGGFDFVQAFYTRRSELDRQFPELKAALRPAGMLWVSWPKKSSKVATDLGEDAVREIGLAGGLVDVKVCAVDETWSGLKLVYRLEDRKA